MGQSCVAGATRYEGDPDGASYRRGRIKTRRGRLGLKKEVFTLIHNVRFVPNTHRTRRARENRGCCRGRDTERVA